MKRNIAKTRKHPLLYIPFAYSFSEIENGYDDSEDQHFDVSDEGAEADSEFNNFYGTRLLLDILYNLEEDEKIIYLCQLAREFGYEIDHGSFAKTMGIHRVIYMNKLRTIREKINVMVKNQHYNEPASRRE